eukprot:gnl/TRDRNA2_/TRDRNA2_175757_c0_seq15.p1 gnl/TRDRNA2_/TRDRNA2_175757_c0~~gnl/TRDRNA2_/TRDRNA2_175757_c0_seq15.p1  ORF type:complete len:152 (+),score=26.26 gnl/TRDRNA2_/TRDRNA2_175757_c0_seq15:138-593(+)
MSKGDGKMTSGEFKNWLDTAGTNVYMKGFPTGITEDQLKAIFGAYGTVASCKVLPSKTNNSPALVRFESADDAKWVVDILNNNVPEGLTTPVEIKFADKPGVSSGKGSWKGTGNQASSSGGVNMDEMMRTMETMMSMMQSMIDNKQMTQSQ